MTAKKYELIAQAKKKPISLVNYYLVSLSFKFHEIDTIEIKLV